MTMISDRDISRRHFTPIFDIYHRRVIFITLRTGRCAQHGRRYHYHAVELMTRFSLRRGADRWTIRVA